MSATDAGQGARRHEPWAVRFALRLFPGPWRARYGDEFSALLLDTGLSPAIIYDVLLAAADARLHPGRLERGWPPVIERLRRSELVIFVCWIVLAVAGTGFAKLTEDPPFTTLRADQPLVAAAFDLVLAGALVSFLALLAAGTPIAAAIALDALRRRRWSQLVLLAVPVLAIGAWIGLTLLLVSLAGPPSDGLLRVALFITWVGSFLVAVAVGTVALGVAALNGSVDERLYRWAVRPALLTVAGMALVALAVIAWGGAVLATQPSVFWGFGGFLATSTALSWFGIAVVMAGSSGVAVRAAVRLHREQRAAG
jgi:hypothetical protein